MALLREVGKVDSDQGEWHELQADPDNGRMVRLRIRRIPESMGRAIEARHGTEEKVQGQKGGYFKQRVLSYEEMVAVATDKAELAWVDCENLSGRPEDEVGAETYTRLLGTPVKAGEEITFDGRLNANVKRHLLKQDSDLAFWIAERAKKMAEKAYSKEKALQGNS